MIIQNGTSIVTVKIKGMASTWKTIGLELSVTRMIKARTKEIKIATISPIARKTL